MLTEKQTDSGASAGGIRSPRTLGRRLHSLPRFSRHSLLSFLETHLDSTCNPTHIHVGLVISNQAARPGNPSPEA